MRSRVAGEGRYARVEREQRWVLERLPVDAGDPVSVTDLYLSGTRLRLRRMETGSEVIHKLAQKVRPLPDEPAFVKLTNMYLSMHEHATLAQLGGAELRKTRRHILVEGRPVAIDELHGRFDGLLLAEVELGLDEVRLQLPAFAVADVTDDDRFSGGTLAHAADADVARLLAHVASLAKERRHSGHGFDVG